MSHRWEGQGGRTSAGNTFYNSSYKQQEASHSAMRSQHSAPKQQFVPEPSEDWDAEIENDQINVASNCTSFYGVQPTQQPATQNYQGGGDFGSQSYTSHGRGRGRGMDRSASNGYDAYGRSSQTLSSTYQRDDWGGGHLAGRPGGGFSGRGSDGFGDTETAADGVEVPSSMVGRIIGKGGSKIRELQEESGAGINVPRDNRSSPKIIIELSGSDEAKAKARQMIEDLVSNSGRRDGYRGGDGYGRASEPPRWGFNSEPRQRFGDNASETDVTEVEISCSVVPRIIGKGGSKIRDIQDQTGARINILRDRSDGITSFVEIKGSDKARADAKEIIDEISESANSRSERSTKPSSRASYSEPEVVEIDWSRLKEESERAYKAKWNDLPPIKKNFYFEDPRIANLHPGEVAQIRKENNNISVQNLHPEGEGHIPNPITTFAEGFDHFPEILELLSLAGFTEPSPIQKQGWPVALSGVDLIGIAQTGTGKTLAFLLPAFIHIENQIVPRGERLGPTVLVLSPTRELALQIESEVNKYSYKGIKCCCVYGGGSRKNQINTITQGVEIIVATPGRLNDLIANDIINLMSVTYLVLDEADRMLDMGFEPEIRKVLLDIRPDRHTLMTSATWPEGVRRLANSYMTNPMQVFVGSLDLAAVHSVHQRVEIIDDDLKRERLVEFLTQELEEDDKVIVFVGRKVTADDISSDLAMSGVTCQCIHGDREQSDREQAILDLKEGTVKILIATDVASRGLDICDITYVFNYDFPRNIEEYVHRVGRTGRAGKTGTSLTLVTRNDWRNARDLIKILEEAEQEVPDELYSMADRFERKMKERSEERRGGGGGWRGGRGGNGLSSFATIGGDRRRGRGRGPMDSGSLFMSCI